MCLHEQAHLLLVLGSQSHLGHAILSLSIQVISRFLSYGNLLKFCSLSANIPQQLDNSQFSDYIPEIGVKIGQ